MAKKKRKDKRDKRRERADVKKAALQLAKEMRRAGKGDEEIFSAVDEKYGAAAETAGFDPVTWITIIMKFIEILSKWFDTDND